jgi:hypothetical protein
MHWRDVPKISRDAFSLISLIICDLFIDSEEKRKDIYSVLDTALLLGSDHAYEDIQQRLAFLDEALVSNEETSVSPYAASVVADAPGTGAGTRAGAGAPPAPAAAASDGSSEHDLPTQLKQLVLSPLPPGSTALPTAAAPTLDEFESLYMLPAAPVLLRECIDHWPAMAGHRAWGSLDYIRRGKTTRSSSSSTAYATAILLVLLVLLLVLLLLLLILLFTFELNF